METWIFYVLCACFLGGGVLIVTLYVRLLRGKRNALSVCSVSLDETGVKGRVKGVMKYKKPHLWAIAVCILLCIVTAVLFITVPMTEEESTPENSTSEQSSTESLEESTGEVSREESTESGPAEELSFTIKKVSKEEAEQHAVYAAAVGSDEFVYFAIIPNRPITMVMTEVFTPGEAYVRDIPSYSKNTISWVTQAASDWEFREIAANEPIYVYTDQPSQGKVWGISWAGEEDLRRYVAVFTQADGSLEAVEMTYSKDCKNYLPPIEIDYDAMKVIHTLSDQLLVLEDPEASEDQRHVLVKRSSSGVYTELLRRPDLSDTLMEASTDGEWVMLIDPNQQPLQEGTMLYVREKLQASVDLSPLPDDEAITGMKWIDDRELLFVSRQDDGKALGGDLWSFALNTKELRKIFAVADERLQITGFDIQTIEEVQRYFHLRAVYYSEDGTSFEEKTFTFTFSEVTNMSSYRRCFILAPEDQPYIRPATEEEVKANATENATPGALLTDKYVVIPHEGIRELVLCTFTPTGENGSLYTCQMTRNLGKKDRYAPLYIQGNSRLRDGNAFGFFASGRYYAILKDPASGIAVLTDVTDRIVPPTLPADPSTLFNDIAKEYDDYRKMDLWNQTVLHIYDWDQYFAVDRSANGFYIRWLDYHLEDEAAFAAVSGDTALFFSTAISGKKWGIPAQSVVIYRLEKDNPTPAVTVIEAPPLLHVTYRYSAVTEDVGYLFVFEQDHLGLNHRHLALLLKTSDGGKTWEKVPMNGTIASGNNLQTAQVAKFLTEDMGVLSFESNSLSTLPDQVHYTLDGGKTWQTMSSLGNLPFKHISFVSLYDIALEDGIYTITLHEEFVGVTIHKFRSNDLENWERVE